MNELQIIPATVSVEKDWGSRSQVQTLVLMAITVIGIYLCYRMALPFRSALAWALALAVLFAPFHRWLESRIKRPNLAAMASVILISLIVVVPTIFVGQRLVQEANKGAAIIEGKVGSGEWSRLLTSHPRVTSLLERVERQLDLQGAIKGFAAWMSTTAGSVLKGSAFQVIDFCLTFYLLFYFLRDRRLTLHAFRRLAPLSKPEMDQMFRQVGDTVHATIYGTLAVSFVQGLLGGLMFWALGIPSPLLWGIIMALLAIMPIMGTFVVWIPVALFLAIEGSWGKALILVLWGLVVVGTIDNLLRPVLVGGRLNLHSLLAFMSVVGGLLLFGAAGLILGPVALTITSGLLGIWTDRARASEILEQA